MWLLAQERSTIELPDATVLDHVFHIRPGTGTHPVLARFTDLQDQQWDIVTRGPERALGRKAEYSTAAAINNILVLHGWTSLELDPGLPAAVVTAIATRFSQLTSPLASGGRNRAVNPPPRTGLALGVNVGQTQVKFVLVRLHDLSIVDRRVAPTPRTSGRVAVSQLERLVRRTAEAMAKDSREPISHAGLSLGGIVRNGQIARGSGLTLGMDDSQFHAIESLAETIGLAAGSSRLLPTTVLQDVEARALFHSHQGIRDAYLLDVGTSLGGAYIDAEGSVSPLLNQVGRVAVDISENARQRRDGGGAGLASQYLSGSGIAATLFPTGQSLRHLSELQEVLAGMSDQARQNLADQLGALVRQLVQYLRNPSTILLTGGVIASGLLKDFECQARIVIADDPVFDSAAGAAIASAVTR